VQGSSRERKDPGDWGLRSKRRWVTVSCDSRKKEKERLDIGEVAAGAQNSISQWGKRQMKKKIIIRNVSDH